MAKPKFRITTMRLPPELMRAATKRAARMRISRTRYIEGLVRADLKAAGMIVSDADEVAAAETVFS
jgi:hypothetical protein